jgi:hypothetical protein
LSPAFSLRITLFQDSYLTSGEFVGNSTRIAAREYPPNAPNIPYICLDLRMNS